MVRVFRQLLTIELHANNPLKPSNLNIDAFCGTNLKIKFDLYLFIFKNWWKTLENPMKKNFETCGSFLWIGFICLNAAEPVPAIPQELLVLILSVVEGWNIAMQPWIQVVVLSMVSWRGNPVGSYFSESLK